MKISKFETNRRVIKTHWLKEEFPPYEEESWSIHYTYNPYIREYKRPNKRLYTYQVRQYRTWKYNRKTQYK